MKKKDRKELEGMLNDIGYGKKACSAHTLTHEELRIKPCDHGITTDY